MNEELGNLLVKNTIYLLKTILSSDTYKEQISLAKYFKKASLNGRKLMLNFLTAQERLAQLSQFYIVSIHLMEELTGSKDNDHVR